MSKDEPFRSVYYDSANDQESDEVAERLKGVRESLIEESDTIERKRMREVKKQAADEGNPYPHTLRES